MTKTPTSLQAIHLKDYQPPEFLIDSVELHFNLYSTNTTVRATLVCRKNPTVDTSSPLALHGEALVLLTIQLDDEPLTAEDYEVTPSALIIHRSLPEVFTLTIETRINPRENTALSGLYASNGNFCTQCEAQGFRRMMYFLDRSDVMATYTTTIEADKTGYPTLLSNGNFVDKGDLPENRHWVKWHDPFKKPSYLFALVAGDFDCLSDHYVTQSNRTIDLRLYVEKGNLDQTAHAMASLKAAMAWDETEFGRECDLDNFMIVAVSDFNMGAMENKGLNIFNSQYVLANPQTATDTDYEGIITVVGHEYFHNWTGNRITCRDWFQLSLKEGLTVFRDQQFTGDQTSQAVTRIDDVNLLRTVQFTEDAGPMAHPVRPDSYIEVNNFYTATVYNKGAEVIRMMHTLLGKDGFRRGMDLYFERHDGQAVTCDDFVKAMEDPNDIDLTQFRLWYSQAGTPEVKVETAYDSVDKTYTLTFTQRCPDTPGQSNKKPFHIPIAMALFDQQGHALPLNLPGESGAATTRVFDLKEPSLTLTFTDLPTPPVPSLFRHFSSPVKVTADLTDSQYRFLMVHDTDPFNRWDAGQQFARRTLLSLIETYQPSATLTLDPAFIAAFRDLLEQPIDDPALLAQMLVLPTEQVIGEAMPVIDVEAIYHVRQFVRTELANALKAPLLARYEAEHSQGPYEFTAKAAGDRRLRDVCLAYLRLTGDRHIRDACVQQFETATNMTDRMGALSVLTHWDDPVREDCLEAFYQAWRDQALLVDKWFSLQACSELPNTLETVKTLMKHPDFSLQNPNKVRALIGVFTRRNRVQFHAADGAGYSFLGDQIEALNSANPQIAARLMEPFTHWRRYDEVRQTLIKAQLQRLANLSTVSKDVYEIAVKSLG